MGFIELFEIGFFEAFWNWSAPILTILIYFCIATGFALQFILQKKCRKPAMRWSFIILCAFGIIISECAWQSIIGWNQIVVDIIYGLIVCLLFGAVIAMIVALFKSKHKAIRQYIHRLNSGLQSRATKYFKGKDL